MLFKHRSLTHSTFMCTSATFYGLSFYIVVCIGVMSFTKQHAWHAFNGSNMEILLNSSIRPRLLWGSMQIRHVTRATLPSNPHYKYNHIIEFRVVPWDSAPWIYWWLVGILCIVLHQEVEMGNWWNPQSPHLHVSSARCYDSYHHNRYLRGMCM